MTSLKERTKVIRKALNEVYGAKNVRVRKGSGTACGWVYIGVKFPKEIDILADRTKLVQEVEDLARGAMMTADMSFDTYYSDDGYNTKRECVIIDVKGIENE